MNFSIKASAPNPLALSARTLAVVGYALEHDLTEPAIRNLRIDGNAIGVLTTSINGHDVALATVDEVEEILDQVTTALHLAPADAFAATQMFFDKLYKNEREVFVCL